MNKALRSMGYSKDQHTSHGFRASASTILNGRGYRHDVIEAQLAHIEPNQVRRAYNRAQYWSGTGGADAGLGRPLRQPKEAEAGQ